MSANGRNGNRKARDNARIYRTPELGYYFIVTDTEKTEEYYMNGLRDSMPLDLRGKLVIKVSKASTKNLVEEAKSLMALHPQYGEPWIVFDRDKVKQFSKQFENKTNLKYTKADKNIYNLLCKYGDEENALLVAEAKLKEQRKKYSVPSQMFPATTLHELVGEIRVKAKLNKKT